MAIQVQRFEARCPTCPRWVWWEMIRTEVEGTRPVTISRCPSCDKR